MKESTTFGKLEGGKTFIVLNPEKENIPKEGTENLVFLKFIPKERSRHFNCMSLKDQEFMYLRNETEVLEVKLW